MRVIIYISLFLYAITGHSQQQILYTQFMFNKQAINPAFVGNEKGTNLTAIYRTQWIGLEGAPTAQHISGSMQPDNKNIGLGVNLTRVSMGIESRLSLDGLYAYKIKMATGILSGGLQLSYQSYMANFSDPRLVTIDGIDIDPAIQSGMRSTSHFNTGIGVYYNTTKYYVGLSVPRLLNANIDDDDYLDPSTLQRHYYLMGGYNFSWNEDLTFTSQTLLKYLRSAPLDLDLNIYATYKKRYSAGITYRLGGDSDSVAESIDVIAGIQINDSIFASMAYDITLSSLRRHQSGSVEVLIYYRFFSKKKPEDFISPRFF